MFLFPCGWWTCTVILFDYFNLSLINSFCSSWFSLLLLIYSFSIIWFSLRITHQLLLYYLIIPIIYYASFQFVFIYLFLPFITYFILDGWWKCHISFQYYYFLLINTFVLFDHHYYYIDHLSLFFIFSSHISLLMADANAKIYIISVFLFITHQHIFFHNLFLHGRC